MIDQTRLDLTRADSDRPRKKPLGRNFWTLYTAFLFFGPALAVVIAGYLIYNAGAADEPANPPIPVRAEEAAPAAPRPPVESAPESPAPAPAKPDEDPVYQDESGAWRNTKRGADPEPHFLETGPAGPADGAKSPAPPVETPAAPNMLTLGLNLLSGGQNRANQTPVRLAKSDQFYQDESGVWRNTGSGGPLPTQTEHIYQDENGVWRNLARSQGPDSASPAPADANPMASLMGGLLGSGANSDGGGGDLGALMGSLLGSGQSGGGGDLGALMGSLMGSGQSGGGDLGALMGGLMGMDQGGGGGDLGALMGGLMGVDQGGGGGDLSGLLNGLMPSMSQPGKGFGPEETAPMNITRARPQAFDYQAGPSRASQITSTNTGLSLEGYERFDPAQAGEIKSEWEFFDDPR